MSLPIAARGEKDYLSGAWSAVHFDFELACRTYGRNDAFWVLCYRAHLAGESLPDEAEARKIVRRANRATCGLNRQGERERYTLYEAMATIAQVSSYPSAGLLPLLARRRAFRRVSPAARRLLVALCDVAERAKRREFACSHRRLAVMAGVDRSRVAGLLRELETARQVFRCGFTRAHGHPSGTSRFTLYPPRPAQNVDEAEPPTWDVRRARWTWSTPLAKGRISQARYLWLARRAQRASTAGNVPNVSGLPSTTVASAFRGLVEVVENPLRGSP